MTDEEIKLATDLTAFNLFKLGLINYVKKSFQHCDSFMSQLEACKTEQEITKLFTKYNDDVYERLGGDPELEDEVNKLERKVRNLEDEIGDLEFRVNELESIQAKTLDEEFTQIFFDEYRNNYTPWEIEDLLKNGKQYLKK
jgi:predicted nuclease with TOPRIM domain